MRMFILCGCNSEAWRALSFAAFAAVFIFAAFRSLFARYPLPFAVPFVRSIFAAVPFALLPYLLPSNGFNVHLIQFLGLFKRVICFVRTFAPFALFRALIQPYFALFCRFRGRQGAPPLRPAARGATEVAQNFEISEKIFSEKSLASYPMPFEIFFLENSLSPFASCLPFQCQNPAFMVPFLVCVPTRPHRSLNLLKETPFQPLSFRRRVIDCPKANKA